MVQEAIRRLFHGESLSKDTAFKVMESLMRGEATDAQIGALLAALRMKGETIAEVAGFAAAMRKNAIPVIVKRKPLLDTCGTGGGSIRVFNVSTAVAFVAAAAGIAVAKHGNRAASGVCGSADVLEALNVNVNLTPEQCAECIDTIGIGFLFARSHHPSMKHVAAARSQIGVRTVFNLLGPLANPAGATLQVMGVYSHELCPIAIGALKDMGTERAMVFSSQPGLDEISTFSSTRLCVLEIGEIKDQFLEPHEFGLEGIPTPNPDWFLPAATPEANAEILCQSIGKNVGVTEASEIVAARRNLVAVNAAAALRIGGVASSWPEALSVAHEIIRNGDALDVVRQLSGLTQSFSHLP